MEFLQHANHLCLHRRFAIAEHHCTIVVGVDLKTGEHRFSIPFHRIHHILQRFATAITSQIVEKDLGDAVGVVGAAAACVLAQKMTFSIVHSGESSGNGSGSVTSSPAPAIQPSCKARGGTGWLDGCATPDIINIGAWLHQHAFAHQTSAVVAAVSGKRGAT